MSSDPWIAQITRALSGNTTLEDIETAWSAYETLHANNQHTLLSVSEMAKLGNRIERLQIVRVPTHTTRHDWQQWGERLLFLLSDMEGRISSVAFDPWRQNWYRLRASALALTGQIDEAVNVINVIDSLPLEAEYKTRNIYPYRIIVRCMHHYRNAESVVQFLVEHWDAVSSYLILRTEVKYQKDMAVVVPAFRWATFDIVACVQNPVLFLRELRDKWPEKQCRLTGLFIIDALASKDLAFDAAAVLEEMQRQGLTVPLPQQLTVMKALTKASAFELANNMFLAISEDLVDTSYQRELFELGLYLFARQGDIARVEEYAKKLEEQGGIFGGQITLLIHVHAVNSDPTRAIEVFQKYFAPKPQGTRKPDITHFTSVIHAYSRCGDHDGINAWLEKMMQAGYTPDEYVYNVILECFARRGEVASVGAILEQMRASDIPPSHYTYTTVIALLAKRKDPLAAEFMYKKAISDGVVPNAQMVNALMNAHVEAASWEGVITAFNYLKSVARGRGVGITVSILNTMLKAYIFAGAPFQTVVGYMTKMRAMKVNPDRWTYALLIQSACDAGLMDAAMDLFADMEKRSANWVNHLRIDVYVLTIIMAGYLRLGLKARAKAIYDDMIARGIQPNSHTFHHIIRTYSNPKSKQTIRIAEEFLKSVMKMGPDETKWTTANRSVRNNLDYLYGPLLAAYRARGSQEDVERLLQDMFDAGGIPKITNLCILLDLYRRKQNIEGVQQIWTQIHQIALQESDVDSIFSADPNRTQPRRQGNMLCIPLSIYIDALSAAGRHLEVPTVWRQLTAEGFTFDSHNWNHLVVALVRAGEVERAFEVIERVIIAYRHLARELSHPEDNKPPSPLTTELQPLLKGTIQRPVNESPMHNARRRAQTLELFTKEAGESRSIMNLEDFAHPLYILQKVSPAWNAWRPHGVVLALLHKVLKHLARGKPVSPIGMKNSAGDPSLRAALTPEELEERQRLAQPNEILSRIHTKFPLTVNAIKGYREVYDKLRRERREYMAHRRILRSRKRAISIHRRKRRLGKGSTSET